MMIPAYQSDWEPCIGSKEDYILNTTRATTKGDVTACIEQYIRDNDCSADVIDLLYDLLSRDSLLDKTHVVCDGSYRNCTILIRPDGVLKMGPRDFDWKLFTLDWYEDNADTLFLNMTDETWTEVNEWCSQLDDTYSYDYEYGEHDNDSAIEVI